MPEKKTKTVNKDNKEKSEETEKKGYDPKKDIKLKPGFHTVTLSAKGVGLSAPAVRNYIQKGYIEPPNLKIIQNGDKVEYQLKYPQWCWNVNNKVDKTKKHSKVFDETLARFVPVNKTVAARQEQVQEIAAKTEHMNTKQQLEYDRLEIENRIKRTEYAQKLGELVVIDDVKSELQDLITDLRNKLDDMCYKIAEKGANKTYDELLDITQIELNEVYKAVQDG